MFRSSITARKSICRSSFSASTPIGTITTEAGPGITAGTIGTTIGVTIITTGTAGTTIIAPCITATIIGRSIIGTIGTITMRCIIGITGSTGDISAVTTITRSGTTTGAMSITDATMSGISADTPISVTIVVADITSRIAAEAAMMADITGMADAVIVDS